MVVNFIITIGKIFIFSLLITLLLSTLASMIIRTYDKYSKDKRIYQLFLLGGYSLVVISIIVFSLKIIIFK